MGCIYALYSKVSNKAYIGQTKHNIRKRLWEHQSLLRNGKHRNLHLQRFVNKYGLDSLEAVVLKDNVEALYLTQEEGLQINNHRLLGFSLFNIVDAMDSPMNDPLVVQKSINTRKSKGSWYKQSEIMKAVCSTPEARLVKKQAACKMWKEASEDFRLNHRQAVLKAVGRKVEIWRDNQTPIQFDSITEAETAIGASRGGLQAVCAGRRKAYKGYQARYLDLV